MQTGLKYEPVRKEDIVMGQILGRGNGGFVYQAFHKSTGIDIAVKVNISFLSPFPPMVVGYQSLQQRVETPILQ